jgi:central glycolytic genes regulator
MSIAINEIISLQQKIVPDLLEVLLLRYKILQTICFRQPIGRRSISEYVETGERIVRKEVYFLRDSGLVRIEPQGVIVTQVGEEVMWALQEFISSLQKLPNYQVELERRLGLDRVIIIPGDCEHDELVFMSMGKILGKILNGTLKDGDILAVTGGTTLSQLTPFLGNYKRRVLVVPAQGGLGEKVDIQANTLAATIAERLGAKYRLLHVSDDLERKSMALIMEQQPMIRETIALIKRADVLVKGIGDAYQMAKRRRFSDEEVQNLISKKAVGEALGCFFDISGRIVHNRSIGIDLDDLDNIGTIIAIAGGAEKAKAILAVLESKKQHMLITDSSAAKEMLRLLNTEYKA